MANVESPPAQHIACSGGSGGPPKPIELPPGAQHLQYNSPLNLYSQQNVEQAISTAVIADAAARP
jgi:hypothetical protein